MRRYFLIIVLQIVIITLSACVSDENSGMINLIYEGEKNIDMYITTDIHYLSPKLTDYDVAFQKYVDSGDGKNLRYIDEILDSLIFDIAESKGDLLIVSGDLTNNGERISHEALAAKFKGLEEAGTSVFVIPGNHDVDNPWARGFEGEKQYLTDSISPKEFAEIYVEFGYGEAALRDAHSLSYLVTLSDDVWLLMLDTNKYINNQQLEYPQTDGEISIETMEWIKQCRDMAEDAHAEVLTVMHHNVIHHSDMLQKGFTLNNNEALLEVLSAPEFKLFLSGHIHTQDITASAGVSPVIEIVTNALSVYPHQYGLLAYDASEKKVEYTTTQVNVEGWSGELATDDEQLREFKTYSKEYFGKFAYDMAYRHLVSSDSLTNYEVELMAEVVELLNIRFFSGTEYLNADDIQGSEGHELWIGYSEGFLGSYVESIMVDNVMHDNLFELYFKNN